VVLFSARTCFITTFERAKRYRKKDNATPVPDVEYPIRGKEVITITGTMREYAFEVLFPEDNDRLGLPYIVLDAILRVSNKNLPFNHSAT
jgi:actin-related protein 10